MADPRKERFRAHLAGSSCLTAAGIFDPISARLADHLGFPIGMLAGSVASAYVLAAPDVAVMTSHELAQQARRITQVAELSLMVDADHGFGNALNVMRTVTELEAAGVCAMTLEDSVLPARHGAPRGQEIVTTEEMVGKLEAALAARRDAATAIIGRTEALKLDLPEDQRIAVAIERATAYAATGIDAFFVTGVGTLQQAAAISDAVDLPIVASGVPRDVTDEQLSIHGFRIALRGHAPFRAMVQGIYRALEHQAAGRPADELQPYLADDELQALATNAADHTAQADWYLGTD